MQFDYSHSFETFFIFDTKQANKASNLSKFKLFSKIIQMNVYYIFDQKMPVFKFFRPLSVVLRVYTMYYYSYQASITLARRVTTLTLAGGTQP